MEKVMRIYDIIEKKRDGLALTRKEIKFFIENYMKGTIADYQVSALLMAIYLKGMNDDEVSWLTHAMIESGEKLDLSKIQGVTVDKHSTGGVADTTSLILVPLLACAGVKVAKMSGKGLGHTGGTIDKLESIPGLNTSMSMEDFIKQVNTVGAGIIQQTKNICPADKQLYALRDVTATVESTPLIASSIMSKKLAMGTDKIILDVKCGNGAFMKDEQSAKRLARQMVAIGEKAGVETVAAITDMNQPLGDAIGNALEVIEAVQILKGEREGRLKELAVGLGGKMLKMAGLIDNSKQGAEVLKEKIASGKAIESFCRMIEAQGGDSAFIHDYRLICDAKYHYDFVSDKTGYVKAIDTKALGNISLALGAGRLRKEDPIEYEPGIWMYKKIGDEVKEGEVMARLLANDEEKLEQGKSMLHHVFHFSDTKVKPPQLIKAIITSEEEKIYY